MNFPIFNPVPQKIQMSFFFSFLFFSFFFLFSFFLLGNANIYLIQVHSAENQTFVEMKLIKHPKLNTKWTFRFSCSWPSTTKNSCLFFFFFLLGNANIYLFQIRSAQNQTFFETRLKSQTKSRWHPKLNTKWTFLFSWHSTAKKVP